MTLLRECLCLGCTVRGLKRSQNRYRVTLIIRHRVGNVEGRPTLENGCIEELPTYRQCKTHMLPNAVIAACFGRGKAVISDGQPHLTVSRTDDVCVGAARWDGVRSMHTDLRWPVQLFPNYGVHFVGRCD